MKNIMMSVKLDSSRANGARRVKWTRVNTLLKKWDMLVVYSSDRVIRRIWSKYARGDISEPRAAKMSVITMP